LATVATRYDVSQVPPQGGYVAKRCPVRAQNDTLRPCEPLPVSAALERRLAAGRDFEASVIARLVAVHPDVAVVTGASAAEREAATLAATRAGAALIIGARLPTDHAGRRVGEPDLLVAGSDGAGGGYRAVDVKHHLTLEASDGDGARCSGLAEPRWEASAAVPGFSTRKRRGDLLQLAHYQAMLEAAGLAAGDGRLAGIIGVEGRIVWHDLDAPIWSTPSSSAKRKKRSIMEVYTFEFDFRLDIIAVARRHLGDPSTGVLLVPVRIAECEQCPWWVHCGPVLESGDGDVSLLAGIGWREWKIHRDHGVGDRAALARLDPRSAALVAAGVEVTSVLDAARRSPAESPIEDVVGRRRPAQLARLTAAGVLTASDARGLCATTASYSGAGLSALPAHIDLARAALGSEPAYRRRGVSAVVVPRADVEVDIDLENVDEGVYLWGALVTDRAGCGVEGAYRAFVSWEPMVPAVELAVFESFWRWLSELGELVRTRGATFKAYCYNAGVESNNMARLAHACGRASEVAALVGSAEWVDLLDVFRTQLITGSGNGLKVLAPLAGYRWPVEDPGGEESMLRYDTAVAADDEGERQEAREWLLAYNRGDVEATLALRRWLDRNSDAIVGIEDWVPPATRAHSSVVTAGGECSED
jgi:predicted RecB family nuclease